MTLIDSVHSIKLLLITLENTFAYFNFLNQICLFKTLQDMQLQKMHILQMCEKRYRNEPT